MEDIYLASASPRRVELLNVIGLPFEQVISNVSEVYPGDLEPSAFAEALAVQKARVVAKEYGQGLVIGADTIVVHGNNVLGKPENHQDAIRMLKLLGGTTHLVISGIAIVNASSGRELVSHEITEVTFRFLSDEEINCYVATGEPMDKAGAYGIQGVGGILVERINGCYNNVVGLPLTLLVKLLKKMGVEVWTCIGKGE